MPGPTPATVVGGLGDRVVEGRVDVQGDRRCRRSAFGTGAVAKAFDDVLDRAVGGRVRAVAVRHRVHLEEEVLVRRRGAGQRQVDRAVVVGVDAGRLPRVAQAVAVGVRVAVAVGIGADRARARTCRRPRSRPSRRRTCRPPGPRRGRRASSRPCSPASPSPRSRSARRPWPRRPRSGRRRRPRSPASAAGSTPETTRWWLTGFTVPSTPIGKLCRPLAPVSASLASFGRAPVARRGRSPPRPLFCIRLP